MINEERTLEEFGHTSDMLTHGSRKRVWRVCEGCGKEDDMRYCDYTYGSKICGSCSQKGKNNPMYGKHHSEETRQKLSDLNKGENSSRFGKKFLVRGPFNIEYFYTVKDSIDNGYINEFRTFDAFGHYSIDLLHGSNEKIWRVCEGCGNESIILYKNYTSGQKMCSPCAKKGEKHHMYGKHPSEETRQKMSAAQQRIPYEEWKSFATNSPYCLKFNEAIKEYIRNKYGRRCFLCDKPEKENITSTGKMRKLSVHHVDMNKNQGCNGHEWRLVPLCMKCHNLKTTREMQQYIEYILADESLA